MALRARVESKKVAAALRALRERGTPATFREAFKRLGFDARDELGDEVRKIFSGPRTEFFAKSFRFRLKTPSTYRAVLEIFALRKGAAVLISHLPGARPFTPRSGKRLAVTIPRQFRSRTNTSRALAIPAKATGRKGPRLTGNLPSFTTRGRRGRVPASRKPGRLLAPGGKGFVSASGNAILVRTGRKGRRLKIAYVLEREAQNKGEFRFFRVVRDLANRGFSAAVGRAISKQVRTARSAARISE